MISSPSAQIVNAIAEKTFVTSSSGNLAPAYGPVMGVATAIIATGIAVTTAFGPEKRGRHFETAVAGAQDADAIALQKEIKLEEGVKGDDKTVIEDVEKV